METLPTFVLEPPYTMVRWLRDAAPSLGSILLLDGTGRRPRPNDVRELMSLAPWCPVVVLGRDRGEVRPIRRTPRVAVIPGQAMGDDLGSLVLQAVAARAVPTPSDLTEWVVRRTNSPLLSRTLADLFSSTSLQAGSTHAMSSTWQRQLAHLGTWSAADWQVAAHLAELSANRVVLPRVVHGDDPRAHGTRQLLDDCQRECGHSFERVYGWEWVLEVALRQSGYFERAANELRLTIGRRTGAARVDMRTRVGDQRMSA
jgi:hypothetical protein